MDKDKPQVLFSDVDTILARVTKVKFKGAGWNVIPTATFSESIEKFKSNRPKTVITEILLTDDQGRGGFELIKEIRKLDKNHEVTVVVLTDLSQGEDRVRAMAYGADHYFVKSEVSMKRLMEELKDIVK